MSDQSGQNWLLISLVAIGREFGHRKTRKDPARRFCLKTWKKHFVNIWVWDALGHLDSQTLEPALKTRCLILPSNGSHFVSNPR